MRIAAPAVARVDAILQPGLTGRGREKQYEETPSLSCLDAVLGGQRVEYGFRMWDQNMQNTWM